MGITLSSSSERTGNDRLSRFSNSESDRRVVGRDRVMARSRVNVVDFTDQPARDCPIS